MRLKIFVVDNTVNNLILYLHIFCLLHFFSLLDIDLTLQSLDNVISFYSVSQEVDDVIRKGPGLLNEGANLDLFLNALNRLAKANVYFLKNNPESVEIENVVSFFFIYRMFYLSMQCMDISKHKIQDLHT